MERGGRCLAVLCLAQEMGRTSIIVVAYNHRAFLGDCLAALDRAGLDPGATRVIVVDNGSSDGTAEMVRRDLLTADGTATRGGLPALLLAETSNRGFSGGNNLALRRALDDGDEFAYFLNPDTEVQPGFLAAALAAAAPDPRIALVQSLLVRHPETHLVNSYGNALNYLGIGHVAGDGRALDEPEVVALLARVRDIPFASGAASLVRLSVLARIGLFNEELFLYCEDLELTWRARLAGFRAVFAPASRVAHKYEFSRNRSKYYFIERNRLLVLAWCYRLPTLGLISPALLALELGSWTLAATQGWWPEKLRAVRYFARLETWQRLLATRRQVQGLRVVDDRELGRLYTARIELPALGAGLLGRVANPLLAAHWRLVRALLRW
jgi:GT2 family glycosyltransferase